MHGHWVFSCLFLVFRIQLSLVSSKIILSRVKPIHISRIATLCLENFFDPRTTSQSSYKKERLWICGHLESKSKSPRAFFVAQYVNETIDITKDDVKMQKDAPVVGFVELAMSSEYNRILSSHYDESLIAARLPFRDQRPKISALVVDRNYRRLGIGGLLINACILQACKWTSHGANELFLDVAADNMVAYSFYRTLGFVTCPFPCQTTETINDRPVDNNIQPSWTINPTDTTAKVIIMYKMINCDEAG